MRSTWLVLVSAIFLLVAAFVPAEAALNYADDICPDAGGTEFVVDTLAEALVVQNGYNLIACNIIIKISLNPVDNAFIIKAKSIRVEGDGVTALDIINATVTGDVTLLAVGGNINIVNASVKAKDIVRLECTAPLCRIDVDDSSIIASQSLDPFNIPGDPGSGFATLGELFITARGDIDLQRSDIYGGAGVHFDSQQGGVAWFCPGPGASGCIDPFAKPFVADTLCPQGFPCSVTFQTAADLKAVCFPGLPGRVCGGGHTEIRVTAYLDIDIRGTTIFGGDHITFTSVTGSLLAGPRNGQPSVLDVADSIAIVVKKKVDMTEAEWTSQIIRITSGTGCVAADAGFCIDASKSVLTAGSSLRMLANNKLGDINACAATMTVAGAGLPILNSDSTSPYDPNVADTAAECNALVPPLAPLAAF